MMVGLGRHSAGVLVDCAVRRQSSLQGSRVRIRSMAPVRMHATTAREPPFSECPVSVRTKNKRPSQASTKERRRRRTPTRTCYEHLNLPFFVAISWQLLAGFFTSFFCKMFCKPEYYKYILHALLVTCAYVT